MNPSPTKFAGHTMDLPWNRTDWIPNQSGSWGLYEKNHS